MHGASLQSCASGTLHPLTPRNRHKATIWYFIVSPLGKPLVRPTPMAIAEPVRRSEDHSYWRGPRAATHLQCVPSRANAARYELARHRCLSSRMLTQRRGTHL